MAGARRRVERRAARGRDRATELCTGEAVSWGASPMRNQNNGTGSTVTGDNAAEITPVGRYQKDGKGKDPVQSIV